LNREPYALKGARTVRGGEARSRFLLHCPSAAAFFPEIFNTDQGSQFTDAAFTGALAGACMFRGIVSTDFRDREQRFQTIVSNDFAGS